LRVQVTERHCEVPADTRARAEKQVASLAKYSPRASAGEVLFLEENVDRIVEIIVHIDGEEPVVARAEGTEFRSALDMAHDRVRRRLRKQREQRVDHQAPTTRARVSGD
jgi:ribosomal subunit interface protein